MHLAISKYFYFLFALFILSLAQIPSSLAGGGDEHKQGNILLNSELRQRVGYTMHYYCPYCPRYHFFHEEKFIAHLKKLSHLEKVKASGDSETVTHNKVQGQIQVGRASRERSTAFYENYQEQQQQLKQQPEAETELPNKDRISELEQTLAAQKTRHSETLNSLHIRIWNENTRFQEYEQSVQKEIAALKQSNRKRTATVALATSPQPSKIQALPSPELPSHPAPLSPISFLNLEEPSLTEFTGEWPSGADFTASLSPVVYDQIGDESPFHFREQNSLSDYAFDQPSTDIFGTGATSSQ